MHSVPVESVPSGVRVQCLVAAPVPVVRTADGRRVERHERTICRDHRHDRSGWPDSRSWLPRRGGDAGIVLAEHDSGDTGARQRGRTPEAGLAADRAGTLLDCAGRNCGHATPSSVHRCKAGVGGPERDGEAAETRGATSHGEAAETRPTRSCRVWLPPARHDGKALASCTICVGGASGQSHATCCRGAGGTSEWSAR